MHLVDSSYFQIVWDERVKTTPPVGATTPPLLCSPWLPYIDSCYMSLSVRACAAYPILHSVLPALPILIIFHHRRISECCTRLALFL